jgi:hypothetical protein
MHHQHAYLPQASLASPLLRNYFHFGRNKTVERVTDRGFRGSVCFDRSFPLCRAGGICRIPGDRESERREGKEQGKKVDTKQMGEVSQRPLLPGFTFTRQSIPPTTMEDDDLGRKRRQKINVG